MWSCGIRTHSCANFQSVPLVSLRRVIVHLPLTMRRQHRSVVKFLFSRTETSIMQNINIYIWRGRGRTRTAIAKQPIETCLLKHWLYTSRQAHGATRDLKAMLTGHRGCRLEDLNLLVPTLFDSPTNGVCLIPPCFTCCPRKARQIGERTSQRSR